MKTNAPDPKTVFFVGLGGIVLSLALAIFQPEPSEYQEGVFKVVLALSGAFATTGVAGFLVVKSTWVKAGGPLGVMVFICFYLAQF